MKQSKKQSKPKPKFTVVIFYGPFAVGKYTTAKEFSDRTGFKFFHNHHTYDLVVELFARETLSADRLIEQLRLDIFKEVAEAKINVVTTYGYSADYISKTGFSDPAFVKRIQSIIEKEGGAVYFVHLTADPKVLLKRVTGASRKKFKKLTDVSIMRKVLEKWKDWTTPAPVRHNIEIDNTKLSPKQVVQIVREIIEI